MTKTHALESLVIAGYVRGLSTRDVEASLADGLGAGHQFPSADEALAEALDAAFRDAHPA